MAQPGGVNRMYHIEYYTKDLLKSSYRLVAFFAVALSTPTVG